MALVGPSGSGKTQFIYNMLKNTVFRPEFNRIFYFYQHFQQIYQMIQQEINNIEFIQCIDFDMINELPNDGTN